MMIRPMGVAGVMGEQGRPARASGNKGGSALLFSSGKDSVSLGGGTAGAGLYAPSKLFKIMGSVQLMTPEIDVRGDVSASM